MSDLDLDAIRRRRQSLAEANGDHGPRATRLMHVDVPALLAEVDRLRKQLAEYESAINWSTSCLACSRMLDNAIAEDERADRAEDELAKLRAAGDE